MKKLIIVLLPCWGGCCGYFNEHPCRAGCLGRPAPSGSNEGDERSATIAVGKTEFGYTHTSSGKSFGYIIDFRATESYKNGQRTNVWLMNVPFTRSESYGLLGGNIRISAFFLPYP